MPGSIDALPSKAVSAVLASRTENVGRVARVSALKKALDSESDTAAQLLKMMGIGTQLDVKV
jgi:hypothetical protein